MQSRTNRRYSLLLVLLWPGVCALSACLQVLDIEEAHLDPEAGLVLQDGDSVLSQENAVEACALGFDNGRVTRLVDGQLSPLPEDHDE